MHTDDTIVAISTPPGRGGIGVVRLSGPEALEVVQRLVRLSADLEPRRATLGDLLDQDGAAVDQVVVTWFCKPHSYTCEDVVEVSCHGAPVVLRFLLERATGLGARLAEPGEFTLRAFLNGRLDLAQAEAVRDLIEAQTLYQARVAAQQLGGSVARRLAPTKKELVDLITLLEAGIDFAEDDVSVLPAAQILERIERVRAGLAAYAETFRFGRVVQEGLTLAIVGRPNVGKSSLFNRLVERDRAIVTAAPGTTRDLVTEVINLEGIPLKLVDTAGIRQARDEAETIGVQKSYEALADSDLTLVVLDASAGLLAEDAELVERSRAAGAALLVWNKVDLAAPPSGVGFLACQPPSGLGFPSGVGFPACDPRVARASGPLGVAGETPALHEPSGVGFPACEPSAGETPALQEPPSSTPSADAPLVSQAGKPTPLAWQVSALTGQGVPELRRAILEAALPGLDGSRETGFLTNIRHERLLRDSLDALTAARAAAEQNIPHEMLLLDLYNALRPLDAITGQTTVEDILNQIFSTFCIGK